MIALSLYPIDRNSAIYLGKGKINMSSMVHFIHALETPVFSMKSAFNKTGASKR